MASFPDSAKFGACSQEDATWAVVRPGSKEPIAFFSKKAHAASYEKACKGSVRHVEWKPQFNHTHRRSDTAIVAMFDEALSTKRNADFLDYYDTLPPHEPYEFVSQEENEPILDDNTKVYADYLYIADGRVIRSDLHNTTVAHLKAYGGYSEVRRCDIEGRRRAQGW